jgi:hypothetical protein
MRYIHMTHPLSNPDMAANVSERINIALDTIPLIPKGRGRISAAAQLFGESQHSVRLWLVKDANGKIGMPDIKKIPSVAKILDIKIEWLLTGEGAMRSNEMMVDTSDMIDKEACGNVMRFIYEDLAKMDFFDLAIHKQDTIFGLVYETIKGNKEGLSDEFKSFVLTTLTAMR